MTKEKADRVIAEFIERGGAFVEDEFTIIDGQEVYNPLVDRPNAEQWLGVMLEKA